jgi:hypothetical protein
MPRKKADGIASIVAKEDPVSIQELTMQDFFAAFALQGICASGAFKEWTNEQLAVESYDIADEMLNRRTI